MTSAGVTIVTDGSPATDERLQRVLDVDTGRGVLSYADTSYPWRARRTTAGGWVSTRKGKP